MSRRSRLIAQRKQITPSLRHEREPNTPLPIECCRCDRCESARDDADDRIGRVMGEPELAAEDLDTDQWMRERG